MSSEWLHVKADVKSGCVMSRFLLSLQKTEVRVTRGIGGTLHHLLKTNNLQIT